MLIYLHGFNSSPQSHKARRLASVMQARGLADRFACPALPHWPPHAIAAVESVMARAPARTVCLVGSSLGGFYATHLAEKHGVRAVLLNPAVDAHAGLAAYVGRQRNLYTGEEYEFTAAHLRELEKCYPERVTPERYLLVVETGDEVLDYRRAVARYAGSEQIVVPGGDHALQSFAEHIPRILAFAGL